jgi:LacI family transcriptional regulator
MEKLPEKVRIKDIAQLADVSVGTVDRVIHGRAGVSEESRKRVEKILKQLDFQPNRYASALAFNKKYLFACLLPMHQDGEYWTEIQTGIGQAVRAFSDFNITVDTRFYDPYDYESFVAMSRAVLDGEVDGVLLAPTVEEYTLTFVRELESRGIPYIYIDSNIGSTSPLAFFGQNSHQSGYFAARMLMMLACDEREVAIFRKIHRGVIGSNQQESREKGFRQYMAEHHPDCTIHELDLHAESSDEDARMLNDFFAAHPGLRSGITFNSKAYIIGEYMASVGRGGGEFRLIGYDLLSRNVACLRSGDITFLIAQQPVLQGYNGVKALCDHLVLKKEVKEINYMPIDLLTVETIDYYSNK